MSDYHRNPKEGPWNEIDLVLSGLRMMTREDLVKKIRKTLKTNDDLNSLSKLTPRDLEISLMCLREPADQYQI